MRLALCAAVADQIEQYYRNASNTAIKRRFGSQAAAAR